MREVVHVETQEQYDYVNKKLNYNWTENKWIDEKKKTCIRIDERIYGSLDYYKTYTSVKIISFNEFKSRYELKIGDTFEYNGFVCEVKEEIEESIWFLLKNKHTKSIAYRYGKEKEFDSFDNDEDYKCIKITNKEFIKQLEENALS